MDISSLNICTFKYFFSFGNYAYAQNPSFPSELSSLPDLYKTFPVENIFCGKWKGFSWDLPSLGGDILERGKGLPVCCGEAMFANARLRASADTCGRKQVIIRSFWCCDVPVPLPGGEDLATLLLLPLLSKAWQNRALTWLWFCFLMLKALTCKLWKTFKSLCFLHSQVQWRQLFIIYSLRSWVFVPLKNLTLLKAFNLKRGKNFSVFPLEITKARV